MSDENTTAADDVSTQALIAQVWGDESGPSTGPKDAEEPAEGAAVTEPAKVEEPAKDPAKDRVAARLSIVKRAELRGAEQRRVIAAERAEADKAKAEAAEHVKALEALKAAKGSPSKALELLGYDPKGFLESLATEHEPEAVAKRAVEGTQSDVQKLQARIDAMETAEKTRIAQAERARVDADYNAATQGFIAHVEGTPEKYPHLYAEHTIAEIAHMAQRAADQHGAAYLAKFGHHPDDTTIAEFLEDQAKARAEALAERRARLGQPVTQAGLATPNGQNAATQTDRGPGPRTMTSREASIKASAPKPWSQEAADEESLRILTAAMRG